MSAPFKIPKRSRSDSDSVQMTSPLSRLQSLAADQPKSFAPFRDRTLSGNSSAPHRRTNSIHITLKTRLKPKPTPEPLANGWRPKRASDRLLSPVAVSRREQKPDDSSDSPKGSPQRNGSSLSDPAPLRPISVRSLDALAALRAERHHGSSANDRKCPEPQDTPKTESSWSDLRDVREKQREKWRQFKEKKQTRTHATVKTKAPDQTRTRTRTRAGSEPIVLSSEEDDEEQSGPTIQSERTEPSQSVSERLCPSPASRPSFLQLDFCSFHMGLSRAQANGKVTISESGITVPLRGAEGFEVELCIVATQVRGFGLWDGGVASGGTLFSDSTHRPSGPAPSLLFLSVTDAQTRLLQTELREILPLNTDPLCSLLLLVLKEQLSDLDSALVLSVLDSGDYRKSGSGPGSGPLDWTQGLVLVHSCPSPVDSHLLQLLGQKSSVVGTRKGLRSGAQQMPSRLIQYPPAPSRGRISVSSEDLLCLKHGEFLNDVIIDFYLKYLLLEGVGGAVADRSHVFSSFFYKQLSKRRAAGEDSVPDRHTRHQRVRTWTRNVDVFNKDFLFIPVNQEAHWFLVLVCFPGLDQPKHEEFRPSSDVVRPQPQSPPECTLKGCHKNRVLKRPCILVMDSLKLSRHEAVSRLLRDYLQVEWEVRRGSKRLFPPDVFKTCNCRVPQQDNSSDCGLYLLQYAQAFLQNPVVDFELPVRLETWFPRQQVRDKRDEIRNLVLRLHREQGPDRDRTGTRPGRDQD